MKKIVCVIISIVTLIVFASCGNASDNKATQKNTGKSISDILSERMNETTAEETVKAPETETKPAEKTPVDVDLTELSSTMVYSEVYNMVYSPETYEGKHVRMSGRFTYAEGDNRYYFACIISDATACCAQGIEFVLKDEKKFPDEYPITGALITVSGIFDTYYEGENRYCQLIDAVME